MKKPLRIVVVGVLVFTVSAASYAQQVYPKNCWVIERMDGLGMKYIKTLLLLASQICLVSVSSPLIADDGVGEKSKRFAVVDTSGVCVSWVFDPTYGQHNPSVMFKVSCDLELSEYAGSKIYAPSKKRNLSRETAWALDCHDRSAIQISARYFSEQFWQGRVLEEGMNPTRVPFSLMSPKTEMVFDYSCGVGTKFWPPWILNKKLR